jgi:hypothetical protein
MTSDGLPDEPVERVRISTGQVWKHGEQQPGQAQMEWPPDGHDDESDDQ